jgi:glycosyltransferase involved in cell wall biosynthesis
MAESLRVAFLTHEPFYPPSGGGSAEAVYLVGEMVRRGHDVHVFGPEIDDAEAIEKRFGIHLHPFTTWAMGRYARLRNFKYLAYPFFLERMVLAAARENKFDLIFSQHAISAVAAGKLKKKLSVPVIMNFPDLLTGFMETWPAYIAPGPAVKALENYELSLPTRYDVDGVCVISDALAELMTGAGYLREKICPIYYGYAAEHFPFMTRERHPTEPPVVVMHGSLDFHHLGPIAFAAIDYVTKQRPGTIFRFVGQRTAALEKFLNRLRSVPGCEIDAPGFVPYEEVSQHLADATVGIVPYEESAGTHCAFVAKIVEYVASGLPAVATPLKSIKSFFGKDPMVQFSEFDGIDFGKKIIGWIDAPVLYWQLDACKSAARVKLELDWHPLCAKAVDFMEKTYAAASTTSS